MELGRCREKESEKSVIFLNSFVFMKRNTTD